MQYRPRPSGKSIGTSFMECTAMSASCSSSAVSSSLTNSPLPPIFARGASSSLSPRLTMGTRLTLRPGWACSRRALTYSACHRARALLRVAMRISRDMGNSRKRTAGDDNRMAGVRPQAQSPQGVRPRPLQAVHQLAYTGHVAAADGQGIRAKTLEVELEMPQRRALQALDALA